MQALSIAITAFLGLLSIAAILAIGVVFSGHINKNILELNKSTIDNLNAAIASNKEVADAAKHEALEAKKKTETNVSTIKYLESRIRILEIDGKRKEMKLGYNSQDRDILESIMRIAVQNLTGAPKQEVNKYLAQLDAQRQEAKAKMEDWEQNQIALYSYLSDHPDNPNAHKDVSVSTTVNFKGNSGEGGN